jgi:hypothetical protein
MTKYKRKEKEKKGGGGRAEVVTYFFSNPALHREFGHRDFFKSVI